MSIAKQICTAATLASLLLLANPLAAYAANYALLMNISDYPALGVRDEHDLAGTATDLQAFLRYAEGKLNVPHKNIVTLREREVSRSAVTAALKQLINKVGQRDQVLVAYSGHGGQTIDVSNTSAPGCSEGIITIERESTGFLSDRELRPLFDALAEKAGKLIVFFDSCFSGGALTTRSLAIPGKLRPKYYQKGVAPTHCGVGVNVRGLSRGLGDGKQNVVYIAAAEYNEVAMDSGDGAGGVATRAWMACLNDGKADTDASGGISAVELVRCAQTRIGRYDDGSSIQHVNLEGASGTVMAFNDMATEEVTSPPITVAPVTTSTSTTTPPTTTTTTVPSPVETQTPPQFEEPPVLATPPQIVEPAPAQPAVSVPDMVPPEAQPTTPVVAAAAALLDIYNSRNPKWEVSLESAKNSYRINNDRVDLSVTSEQDGFAYLMMVGTENEGAYLLFPNDFDKDNTIKAGEAIAMPRSGWQIRPGGPPGTDRLVVLISDRVLDFDEIGMVDETIFKKSGNRSIDLARLQRAIVSPDKRSLIVEAADDISYNYGAALLEILEVN